jgi:hypothetical protein
MFVHHKSISTNHHVALESCIRNHPVVTAQMLVKLYEAALQSIDSPAPGTADLSVSHINGGEYTIGTATDNKTGFYVQLVKFKNKSDTRLTVGAKWVMERDNPVHGNTSTTLW